MTEVSDGLVAVLEIEALEELFRVMRFNPFERLADGIGRAAVARQSVGAFFRRHGSDSDDAACQTAMIRLASSSNSPSPPRRENPSICTRLARRRRYGFVFGRSSGD